jgi:predicted regulator of Ras-like GTPase activity (Roadblock/LC7/MglB family)
MTSKDEIQDILEELKNLTNAESALIRKDGRLVFSNFGLDFHSNEIFGAMSTTMLGAAKNITAECRKGIPENIIINTGEAHIIIMNSSSNAFLMCMTNGHDDIDMILVEMQKAAKRVSEIL